MGWGGGEGWGGEGRKLYLNNNKKLLKKKKKNPNNHHTIEAHLRVTRLDPTMDKDKAREILVEENNLLNISLKKMLILILNLKYMLVLAVKVF